MVSEWFREVPDDPGSVLNGSGHIWKVLKRAEGFERYGVTWVILGCPEGSVIGAATLS